MPENLQTIEHTYDLPAGTFRMLLVTDTTDAAYYAAGRQAYVYQSKIVPALYLFIPEAS